MQEQGCMHQMQMYAFDVQMVELNPKIHFPAASKNHVLSSYSQHLHFQN